MAGFRQYRSPAALGLRFSATLPSLPEVKNPKWVRNPVDNFVSRRYRAESADSFQGSLRPALVRRLYLDLPRILPTPAEVDKFLDDRSPDAYEHLVDGLLASPHFGERWGRWWLDAARYADTNGFERIAHVRSGLTGTGS